MSLRPAVVATLCLLTLLLPRPATAEQTAAAATEQASLADHYRRALAIDPGNLPLHYYLGVALLTEDRNHEAIDEFRRAYPAFSDSVEMNYNLGLAYARIGDRDSALLYLDQAEALGALELPELYPLADIYYNMAIAALESEADNEAVHLFGRTLALAPERLEIERLLGDIHARHGRTAQAVTAFATYLEAYPDDATTREFLYAIHFNQGQERLGADDLAGARIAFDEALAASPGSPLAIYYLGYIDYLEGDIESAGERLTGVYTTVPDDARKNIEAILYNSALALLEQRKLRQAQAAIAPLAAQRPGTPKVPYLAGNIHLALREFEQARNSYSTVLELDPGHRGAAMNLVTAAAGALDQLVEEGRALFRKVEYPAALERFEAALAINPAEKRARAYADESRRAIARQAGDLFAAAETALDGGDARTALEHADAGLALTADAERGAALRRQARAALDRELEDTLQVALRSEEDGLLEEAQQAFNRAREIDPENAEATAGVARIAQLRGERAAEAVSRGDLALGDGRLDEARAAYREALALLPGLGTAEEGLLRAQALAATMVEEELQWARQARSAGKLLTARKHFAAALRLDDTPAIRAELGAAEQAITEKASALLTAARAALDKGAYHRAGTLFNKAGELTPEHPDVKQGLAETTARAASATERNLAAASAALAANDYQDALALYRKALDSAPGDARALAGLKQGKEALRRKLDRLLTIAREHLEGGRLAEADALFRQALEIDPFQQEAKAAVSHLERLQGADVRPGDEPRLYLEGIEFYTQGRYEDAVAAWERLLILAPGHEKALMNIEKARRKLRQIREYHEG